MDEISQLQNNCWHALKKTTRTPTDLVISVPFSTYPVRVLLGMVYLYRYLLIMISERTNPEISCCRARTKSLDILLHVCVLAMNKTGSPIELSKNLRFAVRKIRPNHVITTRHRAMNTKFAGSDRSNSRVCTCRIK